MGWLRNAADAQKAGASSPETSAFGVDNVEDAGSDINPVENASVEEVEIAGLSPKAAPNGLATLGNTSAPGEQVGAEKRRRLLGGNTSPTAAAGMALRDVAGGENLPFGEVGRVCELPRAALGQRIERAARKGSDYALYDSAPNSVGPRSFYVTGFSDGCARQFTASLALFGSPEFHEQLRYGLPADEYPYSTTDQAYEKVKKSVCNVGRNTPCGARIRRLNDTTIFISYYENFEDNARWADVLLHDGALLAATVKTP